jgi:transposase
MKSEDKQKISVADLLRVIPDEQLSRLAGETKVDYCAKVLYGRSVFYLLLYALLQTERTGQRTLEDIFKSSHFKFLFNQNPNQTVCHSSISERLSVMNVDFFEKIFELFYERLSRLYSSQEMLDSLIVRVDSSMVAETSAKLEQGMCVGRKKDGKKQVKFTVAFDGLLPCGVQVFNSQSDLCEDLTIPKVVLSQAKKYKSCKVYAFDRGVNKRTTFDQMSREGVEFVSRLNPGSRYHSVRVMEEGNGRALGKLHLIRQEEIQLYKNGGKQLLEEHFRLIIAENDLGEACWFLTDIFDLEAEVITLFYKKRWDIEVFFRFLKQELNFSHFMSVNENGIKIILYMTLILSMLLMIYRRLNRLGYKTAKRRFGMEVNEMIIQIIVIYCGGNPDLFFKSG